MKDEIIDTEIPGKQCTFQKFSRYLHYMSSVTQRLRKYIKYIWNITLIKTIYDRRPYLYRL